MKIEQTTKNAAVMNTASDTMGVDASKQKNHLYTAITRAAKDVKVFL